MKRRNFIKNCLCLSGGGLCAYIAYKQKLIKFLNQIPKSQDNDFWNKEPFLQHAEVHLAEHCNLNCKYCCHFSCIAEKKLYDFEQYKKDMRQLAKVTKKRIRSFYFLGGEPLLHPQVNDFMDFTRKILPFTLLALVTNGVLLKQMPESFWKSMQKNEIYLFMSYYPIEVDYKYIDKKTKEYNILGFQIPEEENMIKYFSKSNLSQKGERDIEKAYMSCEAKAGCSNYVDGKLYPCHMPAYIHHLNKRFGTKFKVGETDYIDIYKTKNLAEILDFLANPMPFCRYCGQEFFNLVPWENSMEHTLDEWVIDC